MSQAPQFDRRLRLLDATTLVAGSMIGSAIFLSLPIMARSVQAPGVLLGVWLVGGLFTLLGAACYAELAAMFPQAGGQYVFLREAYGRLPAFLFGWTQFVVIQTGFNAAVAIAFAKYLGGLEWFKRLGESNVLASIPLAGTHFEINSAQVVACGVIALLTAVNIRGVREGALVQNVFTALKVAALVALIIPGLGYLGNTAHFRPLLPGKEAIEAGFLAGVAVALSKALFAYDAWYTVTFVAEEVHDSHRTLPRALILGTLLVTLLYVLTNAAYMAVLPVGEIKAVKNDLVAGRVAEVVFGPMGSKLVIAAILVSTFGCLNGLILGGARVPYAMAREGLFFRKCAELDGRKTPRAALIFQGVWSMVLALSGSYSELLTYCTFASVLFGGLTVAAVYWLRITQPDRPRPHRCWGYPLTPAAYLLICIPFLVYVIQGAPKATLWGAGLIVAGVPFYLVWRGRGGASE